MGLFLRVLLILLFLANVGCLLTGCQLQTHKRASFFRDGDILIGGDFVVHSEFTSSNPTYTDEPKPALCKGFHTRYYREVLAMVFAIEEINHAQELLPNITLGFRIFDSCMSEKRAIQSTFEILTGRNGVVPGYSCRRRHILAGLIGETMSSLTIPMADVLGIFRYPQISHSAVISTLSDKVRFPAFFRTVPGNTFQNVALARLIGHFGWTWVGMVISDDDVGIQGSQEIQKVNEENGVCVAFVEKVHLLYSMEKVLKVIKRIQQNSETVIVFHSAEMHLKVLLEMMYAQNVTDKVLIFSALFALTPGIYANQAWRILNGALGLVPHTGTMPGFEKFLYDLHPQTAPDDIFIKTFWEKAFLCKWSVPNNTEITQSKEEGRTLVPCSQEKSLDKLDKRLFELNDLSYTYNSYIAVYAFAHGLKALLSCRAGHGPFTHASCADANNIQPWQILHYLKNLHFGTGRGDEMFFDANGDALTSYDILNVQISDDEVFRLENVGTIDSQAPKGSDITLNRSSILWSDGLSQVPRSVCSVSCDPGYRKAAREGQLACCFDCLPCSQGKISNETDLVNCRNCPLNQWPNEKRDKCLLKMTEFLSYEEPLGLALIVTAAILTIFSAIVLWVITKNRNSPIVKANNRGLSYLLLVSLILCFLCAFIFIGSPTKLRCMLRQTAVFLVFTISVSSVLAKNIIVVIAFKAKIQNSIVKKFLSMKTPICVVAFPFLVQGLISVTWILKSPPFPERNMKLYNEKIIFECNEGEHLFFYCMLGYMGFLATVSFIVAFLSRNLPGSFNEAKLITFSMLVFVSVWISFIPAYLSTRGKYMVAVEVFAILCSGAGLLGCVFFPKCYIILVKPDKNTRGYVARQLQFGGKGV